MATFGQPLKRRSLETPSADAPKLARRGTWGEHSLLASLPTLDSDVPSTESALSNHCIEKVPEPDAEQEAVGHKRLPACKEVCISKTKEQSLGLSLSKMRVTAMGVLIADVARGGLASRSKMLRTGGIIYAISSSCSGNAFVSVNTYDEALGLLAGTDGVVKFQTGVAAAAVPVGWKEQRVKCGVQFVHHQTGLRISKHPACLPADVLASKLQEAAADLRSQQATSYRSSIVIVPRTRAAANDERRATELQPDNQDVQPMQGVQTTSL